MKIRKLQLKNIGVFDDETITFQPCPAKDKAEIHIFTGENGTGKTTILMALASAFRYLPNFHKEKESLVGFTDFLNQVGSAEAKTQQEEQLKHTFGNMFDVLQERLFEPDRNKAKADEFCKRFRFFDVESDISKSSVIVDGFEIYGCSECGDIVHSKEVKLYSKLSSEPSNTLIKKYEVPFALFAYSGYRRIKDELIQIGKENDENPLYQALDFVKNENSAFTVNQWIGQNLLNSSLAQTKKKLEEAKHFNRKVQTLEKVINDIIRKETKDVNLKFEMQSATKLVLIKDNRELDFDVLPDGLNSLISWIGDLLMRLDSLKWENDTPIFDREIILFLDEIEVHLHPSWQRKVLPIIQTLFKNAQIFVSTHSPFVVNSVDDAWVYKLKFNSKGKVKKASVKRTENSQSITQVLREVFDIYGLFGKEVQDNIDEFEKLRDKILSNGTDLEAENELLKIAKLLAKEPSDQIKNIVRGELEQLSEIKGKNFLI
ncbi:MAG TPA: AAA family ATPase [Pyrinomonadaceae bacterium]|nr:AAA family ATPase [Pyrinomonadaceae bacterium]